MNEAVKVTVRGRMRSGIAEVEGECGDASDSLTDVSPAAQTETAAG